MESQLLTEPAVSVTLKRPLPKAFPLLLAALTTSALLWLSYFPVNCGWLAWFAFVPFLVLVRSTARPRFVYLGAWLCGLAFYFPALQWMRVADPRMVYAWIFLAVYCSLYFPIALRIIRFFDRRTSLPLVLTLPVVWTALEYFRTWFGSGFSWYLLGHTQQDYLPVIQFVDVTGVYGLSFLIAAVNAVLFEALYRWEWFRVRFVGIEASRPRLPFYLMWFQAGVVAALFIAAVGYGEWRLSQDDFPTGPRIALIQGSVPQQIRNDFNMADMMARHFIALSDVAAKQKPNLIVWPETSNPDGWCETSSAAPPTLPPGWQDKVAAGRSEMHEAAKLWKTNILFGLNANVFEADGHVHQYNSALLVGRDGAAQGRYDKIHCVPLGEYVPLRDEFPWMQYFAPYDDDYSVSAGRSETRFTLDQGTDRSYSFGVVICYEDADAERALPYISSVGGPPVNFLLNISNDGWFDGTSEHDEHLAICRFRAIECRRAVARAVNMGISALIDGNGRIVAPQPVAGTEWNGDKVRKALQNRFAAMPQAGRKLALSLFPDNDKAAVWLATPSRGAAGLPSARWAELKKVPAVLLADMPIDHRFSLYALWGDWLPWTCWALLGLGTILACLHRRRKDIAKFRLLQSKS